MPEGWITGNRWVGEPRRGTFVICGPDGDAGLDRSQSSWIPMAVCGTARGAARLGKDPTKG